MSDLSRLLADFAISAAWQSGIVAFAAFVAMPLLRRASGRARHAALVCAIVAASLVPFVPIVPRATTTTSATQLPDALPNVVTTAPSGVEGRIAEPPMTVAYAIAALYLCLLFRAAIALVRSSRHAARLRASALARELTSDECNAVEAAARALRLWPVPVRFSAAIAAPVTVGALQPVILLPHSVDRASLLAVLGHELAHVRRRDVLLQLAIELITLPLAFHPLLAMLKRRAAVEREIACDELVSPALVEPQRYARVLLSVAQQAAVPRWAVAFGEASALERRLVSLRAGFARTSVAAALGATLIVLAVAAAATRFPIGVFGSRDANLSGDWVLDRKASDFGVINPLQSFTQRIVDDGQTLRSEQTRVRNGQVSHVEWEVRTDAVARAVALADDDRPARGVARRQRRTVVVEVATDDGRWERVRAQLADPNTLVCEGEVRERGRGGAFRFVFRRAEER